MKQNGSIFTHRILPLFGLFCLVFFLFITFNSSVSAMIFTDNSGNEYNVPDLPADSDVFSSHYYFIHKNGDSYILYTLIGFDEDIMKISLVSNYRMSLLNSNNAYFCRYYIDGNSWVLGYQATTTTDYGYNYAHGSRYILTSTVDIYEGSSGETLSFPKNVISTSFDVPYLLNADDFITNPDFKYFFINAGSVTDSLKITLQKDYFPIPELDVNYGLSVTKEIDLDTYLNFDYDDYGNKYYFISSNWHEDIQYINGDSYTITFTYTVNGNEESVSYNYQLNYKSAEEIHNQENFDKLQDSITTTNNKLDDLNNTNKGIFQQIADILSYINPFSENFFVYKLIELLVEAIKGLFIPEDGYFDNYFQELQNWFSERLGFLYYPLDLLFSLFDRFMNLGNGSLCINIPNINEPFTNQVLISAQTLDFNEILSNETLGGIHNIYLLIVDAIVYIGLVVLLYHKYEEVIAG